MDGSNGSSWSARTRMRAGAWVVDNFFRGLSAAGRLHPRARPARHGVTVERDRSYADDGLAAHRFDVYRPTHARGPLPTVFYVHGGGFRILSKDTHWIMALAFARRGYLVVNINYRLAPLHPFPAGLSDAARALTWLATHGASLGADLSRVILAGESAGGNLVTALALCTAVRRPEPFASALFDTGLRPAAVLPACGMLQVSDVERLVRRKPRMPVYIVDRLVEVSRAYLTGARAEGPDGLDLADPLRILERAPTFARPLPPFFAGVGTRDPLLDDTRRLHAALQALNVPTETRYYPGEVHAFHAFVWRAQAQAFWRDTFDFLDRRVPSLGEG